MKYIVYITKNLINDKIYIGVHGTLNPEIFDGYLGCGVYANAPSTYYNPRTPFQYAIKKYGPKNFIRSIIKIFDDKDSAYKLEAELITEKEVYSDKYYNVSLGGIQPINIPSIIYQYDISGKFLKEWYRDEAAKIYSFNPSSIYTAIKQKQKLANFYWAFEKIPQLNMNEYSTPNIPKSIYKYSKEGVCVGIFESLHDFEQPGKICTAIQAQKLYKGNYYSYTLFEKFIPKTISKQYKNVEIFIYDKDGKYIGSEIGITKTLNRIGGKSRGCLYDALNLKKSYKGFQFSLIKVDKMESIKLKTDKKSVDVFDIYGKLLRTYESVNQVISDLHLDSSTVHRVLKGTAKQTKGYIIKYH